MNVLGFCEGVRDDSGGIGIIGVPRIHAALARRGHRNALAIGGRPIATMSRVRLVEMSRLGSRTVLR